MKISITNHTGARNRGCEALVLSKILGIGSAIPGAEFVIHSNDPFYDKWRFASLAQVKFSYLTKTPNHPESMIFNKLLYSSLRVIERIAPKRIGLDYLSSISHIDSSDLVVCSGGDIFTSDYGNLRKHLSYPIVANKKKVYLCSHSIGPFKGADESYFLRAVDGVAAITAREKDTYDYLKSLDVQTDLHFAADVAFTLPTRSKKDAEDFLLQRYGVTNNSGLVALSISQGIIKYSGINKDEYYNIFAKVCDYIVASGKGVLLIPHVMESNPDNNDIMACDEVLRRVKNNKNIYSLSGEPSAVDLKSCIGVCDALIGTRTHATIASMSQGIPTVSIAYSRKAYGIMKDVYGDVLGHELTINAKDISFESIVNAYELALRSDICTKRISEIKERANLNFSVARKICGE